MYDTAGYSAGGIYRNGLSVPRANDAVWDIVPHSDPTPALPLYASSPRAAATPPLTAARAGYTQYVATPRTASSFADPSPGPATTTGRRPPSPARGAAVEPVTPPSLPAAAPTLPRAATPERTGPTAATPLDRRTPLLFTPLHSDSPPHGLVRRAGSPAPVQLDYADAETPPRTRGAVDVRSAFVSSRVETVTRVEDRSALQGRSMSQDWGQWAADMAARVDAAGAGYRVAAEPATPRDAVNGRAHVDVTPVFNNVPEPPALSALSLPPGWVDARDPASGRVFYHNTRTGVSMWDPPGTHALPQPARPAPAVLNGSPVALAQRGAPSPRLKRQPSMDWTRTSGVLLPPQDPADRSKYTVVLDLDETMVYAREGPLVLRPGCRELITLLGQHCETIVWTAGERCYAHLVLSEIDPADAVVKHCIYRHPKWFSGVVGQAKDLALINRPMDRTLLIDNTPDCIRRNLNNALAVADFHGSHADETLYTLAVLIRLLVSSGKTVPAFLQSCPLVKPAAVRTDIGDNIVVYSVGDLNPAAARVNRDTMTVV